MKTKTKKIIFETLFAIGIILVFMGIVYTANPKAVLPIFTYLFPGLILIMVIFYTARYYKIIK